MPPASSTLPTPSPGELSGSSLGYVSQADWLACAGRADLVDVIADEFERRPAPAAVAAAHLEQRAA